MSCRPGGPLPRISITVRDSDTRTFANERCPTQAAAHCSSCCVIFLPGRKPERLRRGNKSSKSALIIGAVNLHLNPNCRRRRRNRELRSGDLRRRVDGFSAHYGFSPVCARMCVLRFSSREYALPHSVYCTRTRQARIVHSRQVRVFNDNLMVFLEPLKKGRKVIIILMVLRILVTIEERQRSSQVLRTSQVARKEKGELACTAPTVHTCVGVERRGRFSSNWLRGMQAQAYSKLIGSVFE